MSVPDLAPDDDDSLFRRVKDEKEYEVILAQFNDFMPAVDSLSILISTR